MPHLTIIALGSRGDVQPLIVLGRRLLQTGFDVTLLSSTDFAEAAAAYDVPFHALPLDFRQLWAGDLSSAVTGGGNLLAGMRGLAAAFGPLMRDLGEAIYAACQAAKSGAKTDAIINQLPLNLFGYSVAEALGIPYITAAVIPLGITRAHPSPLFGPPLPEPFNTLLGPAYNRTITRGMELMGWGVFGRVVNTWRQETLGLPAAPPWGLYPQMRARRTPTLYGYSPHVVPKPADWGSHDHLCGYWFPDDDPDYIPPDDLAAFLADGPPPVVISFGSMQDRDPAALTELVLDALRKTNARGLLVAAWGGLAEIELPGEVFMVEHVPFGWLLPRTAGIVHHGGSGTTGAGLRAGVPSLVVPFGADQRFWGRRVTQLGAGPHAIPRQSLTSERLAYALRVMLEHQPMRQRAAALGVAIREEDGMGEAVRVIGQYVA